MQDEAKIREERRLVVSKEPWSAGEMNDNIS